MTRRIIFWLATAIGVLIVLLAGTLAGFRLASQAREVENPMIAAPAGGSFVTADDTEIYLQEAGPAGGIPVLLIHGVGAWSETWRDTIDALARSGYRVLAIDLPPFGYSFRPTDGDYSTPAQARRILGVLDALKIGPVILVGHSFGARATVEAAMTAPSRLRALVLVSAALGLQQPPNANAGMLERAVLNFAPLRNALVASLGTNPWLTAAFLRAFTQRHDALTPQRIEVYQRPQRITRSTEAFGLWLRQFVLENERPASRQSERYRGLAVPSILIWGEGDTVTPLAQGGHLTALLPNATLATMAGIGHIPHVEDQRAFNALLLEHLARVNAAKLR